MSLMPPLLPPPDATRRGVIVLVHGAWLGEWCWGPIAEHLHRLDERTLPVSLTGHGRRRHESGPHITLTDHVDDVVSAVEVDDLHEVVLVGHSYGGRVISRAWQRLADRVARLVYIDAHAPVAPEQPPSPERVAIAAANGGMIPFSGYELTPAVAGSDSAVAWIRERLVDHSFATLTEPWNVPIPDEVDTTFIRALGPDTSPFAEYAAGAAAHPAWRYHEIVAPHLCVFSHPAELADLIVGPQQRPR